MLKQSNSDQVKISAIKGGGPAMDATLQEIYMENRVAIGSLVRQNNGTEEEAKDIMQETMIAFYENVIKGKFKGESAISTYLYAIARFIWLNRLKRKKIETNKLEQINKFNVEPPLPQSILSKEQEEQFLHLFSLLGDNCKRVLMDSIYHNLDMKTIAVNMDYDNEQIARNKKYLCLKKLKALINEHPQFISFINPK